MALVTWSSFKVLRCSGGNLGEYPEHVWATEDQGRAIYSLTFCYTNVFLKLLTTDHTKDLAFSFMLFVKYLIDFTYLGH